MILRPYQQRVIEETWAWFHTHKVGHPIVEACVAAGKSVIMAAMAHQAMTTWPATRIIVITHQKELLQQNAEKLKRIWPDAPVGIWSSALDSKTIGDITFATIGSIYKHAHLLGAIAMIWVDECHLVNPKEEGMMRAFIADVQRYGNPKVRVVGFTGTPFRGNGVWLTAGDKALFTHITARVKMKELLDLGFLAPLVPATAPVLIDTEGVKVIGDDYDRAELARRAMTVVEAACDSIVAVARTAGRKRWLIFGVDVAHATSVGAGLRARGVIAATVFGDTPQGDRDLTITAYRQGVIECLVNVGIATTGFDVPEVDFIALLRPTRSPVLYVQMMGRGMRISPGKIDCLVADYTTTVATLGPVDAITGKQGRRAKSVAPFKLCPECGSQCAIADKDCAECGHVFEIVEVDPHADKPSGAAMLTSQLVKPQAEVDIKSTDFVLYPKEGKKTSVQVNYKNGVMRLATEWIHFEQPLGSRPRQEAKALWQKWTGYAECPNKSGDAVDALRRLQKAGQLNTPARLVLDDTGKYPLIVRRIYEDEQVRVGSDAGGVFSGADAAATGGSPPSGDQGQMPVVRSLQKWLVPPRDTDGDGATIVSAGGGL